MPFSAQRLSGSANGQLIAVNAASSPGVTIHTAVSGTVENQHDEVWLWATNTSAGGLRLTLEWGNAAACIAQSIPAKSGLVPVVPGLRIQAGEVVRAYGENASQILVGGYVNRMSP